ncbi:MAG: hypothetical protein A2086_11365 [Spirochaetes bacterium GWD1_27_9]|nr:MAG: hypothetical protein A2Z98_07600 [Spirochaetes bacterium GWB1_27_13]OHD33052.1 MAG: hypothetical protein A2086_11365 [Spirochaetes bacterium GWD1_27_9]
MIFKNINFKKEEITNIEDLILILRDIKESLIKENQHYKNENGSFDGIFFRGQSGTWDLLPGLFREGEYIKNEIRLYEEILMNNPDKFKDSLTTFEKITIMQHYGLPTRLLDWTTNALVALFFAVNKDDDEDAEYFLLDAKSLNENASVGPKSDKNLFADINIKIRLECVLNQKSLYDILFDPYYNFVNGLENKTKNMLEETQKLKTPIAAYSKKTNERLKLQSGAFTIHGSEIEIEKESIKPKPYSYYNLKNTEFVKIFKIKKENKKSIKEELTNIGISNSSLFHELEYQCRGLIEKIYSPK